METTFAMRYLRENGLDPAPTVVSALADRLRGSGGQDGQIDRKTREGFAYAILCSFSLCHALWEKHGGRVVLSAFGGCTAKDGMVKELRALESKGSLSFPGGTTLRDELYRSIAEAGGDGVISGQRAREYFAQRPWEK